MGRVHQQHQQHVSRQNRRVDGRARTRRPRLQRHRYHAANPVPWKQPRHVAEPHQATSYLHSGLNRADLTVPLPFPLPTLPNPITPPKALIESVTTVFQTLYRLPLWEAAYAAQKLAVYVTSCDERKLGQWENMTWEDYIGANKRSHEYNRYLADGIIRNLAASKSKDASAHSIGLVGEASVWSILLLGNDYDYKGFDRVLNGPTSSQWLDPWVAHLRSKV